MRVYVDGCTLMYNLINSDNWRQGACEGASLILFLFYSVRQKSNRLKRLAVFKQPLGILT